MRTKRILKVAAWLAAVPIAYVLLLAAPYFNNALFHHNLNVVVPGRLYRSAEMPREDLGKLIDELGIKSVIDLRLSGPSPDENGLTEEQLATAHGAAYRNLPFTSSRTTQRDRLLNLLDAFDQLQPPILIHCTSGSERSGVASAIWLITKENRSPAEASKQLALRYGFNQVERDLRSFFSGRPTLDRVISEYAKERERREISFRDWAREAKLLDPPAK